MKSLANAFKLGQCLVSCEVNHSRASTHRVRLKSHINKDSHELVTICSQMSHGVSYSYEGDKLRNLEPFRKVQIWVDAQLIVTESNDV